MEIVLVLHKLTKGSCSALNSSKDNTYEI